ncbi:hypothetical protein MCOR27_008413 [Pyricularia oryzae]|uniref:GDS1 winged helix domain-containing protein n=2 Tax=Pyricularia TaxID=48558 RepID=A0ABQ8N2C1_PYRGI|nr:hypothetical protein MCOR01_001050 [Pyricularia oryzae]KAI6290087.1 hypothetical protein MCOR33_011535 [Pyricularia grisea]KAH9430432.1 hypothetical protein MCOR02_010135 [Pyricularia oryzae]KAI6251865.1 hypothetical protein MCOR19_011505 [Pyricularia oryzae]KAI6267892.1 hypothetical protein MCOR26_009459 [Pyricularia oryzae]
MPAYNTRKVSLSLPSLGIALPGSGGNHGQRRTTPSSATASPSSRPAPSSAPAPATSDQTSQSQARAQIPSSKKRKASNDSESQSPRPSSIAKKQHSQPTLTPVASRDPSEPTPPPSPTRSVEMADADPVVVPKPFDLDTVNDEIVEAVIRVLISQGNRPHLVKELATILMLQLRIVQQSANPCAIISSRLSSFLKRPCWSASTPCPLAKELETVHPRRTYFYLTTCPHPPFAESPVSMATPPIVKPPRAIITPSLSSGTSASEDAEDNMRRRQLSPSPEIDLSSPEFDDFDDELPSTPLGSLSSRMPPRMHHHSSRHHRGASPPLEKDEKEFTQTANVLQQRKKASGHLLATVPVDAVVETPYNNHARDENLFGGYHSHHHRTLSPVAPLPLMTFSVTSPAIRPSFGLNLKRDVEAESWARLDSMLEWDRSPENIELEELDGLLDF